MSQSRTKSASIVSTQSQSRSKRELETHRCSDVKLAGRRGGRHDIKLKSERVSGKRSHTEVIERSVGLADIPEEHVGVDVGHGDGTRLAVKRMKKSGPYFNKG